MEGTFDHPSPIVVARGIGVHAPGGDVFAGVDLEVQAGSITCVVGPDGSGRSSLLLALAGRMRITDGSAVVAGHRLPGHERAVRRVAGLGIVRGVNDLDPALSLDDHVRIENLLAGRRMSRSARRKALDAAGVDADPSTRLRDANADDALRTGLALAMLREPLLLLVDDVDHDLTVVQQRSVWRLLDGIADAGTAVVAMVTDAAFVPAAIALVRLGTGARLVAMEAEHAVA